MNHRTISAVLTALMTIAATANACDFCNCLYGINPFYNEKNKIAIHFLTQHSSTVPIAASAGTNAAFIQPFSFGRSSIERMMHGTPAASAAGSSEKRRTVELSFQQYLSERIFLTAIVPFTSIEMTTTASRTITGNGDVTVLGRYILTDMMLDDMDYTLAAGAGIKLPTGDHSSKEADGTLMDPREQLGTGTIDGIANLFFITNLGTFTAGMDLTAKINTKDGDDSRIGHSASLNTYLSHDLYRINSSLFALLGIAGIRAEYSGKDRIRGITDPASGVQSLYINIGGQLILDVVKFNASLLLPILQNRPSGGADEGSRLFMGMQFEY
jgi:hypothetical protein